MLKQSLIQWCKKLKNNNISVTVFQDSLSPIKPDAIFPNNWFATFPNKTIFTFPMEAESRRAERQESILQMLQKNYGYQINRELEQFEAEGEFLEGTGSLIFHHESKTGFAAISSRTNPEVIRAFEKLSGYKVHTFHAHNNSGTPFYHTNVMMSIGKDFVSICFDVIPEEEHDFLKKIFAECGLSILFLEKEQVLKNFLGNTLEVTTLDAQRTLLFSSSAKTRAQR